MENSLHQLAIRVFIGDVRSSQKRISCLQIHPASNILRPFAVVLRCKFLFLFPQNPQNPPAFSPSCSSFKPAVFAAGE